MSEEIREKFFRMMSGFKKLHGNLPAPPSIPRGEFFMLMRIQWGRDGPGGDRQKNVPVSCLRHRDGMSMPAMSQMLNNLERKGLVVRKVDENDRRKVTVALTGKGESVMTEAKEKIDRAIDCFIGRYGTENFLALCRLSDRMVDTIIDMKKENQW